MGSCNSKSVTVYSPRIYNWRKDRGPSNLDHKQRKQRKQRREEEDLRSKELARAQAHYERKVVRRQRYQPVMAQNAEFRRQYDEYMAMKGRQVRRECAAGML